jgi:hypothetical protein
MPGARPGRDDTELVALYRYTARNIALRREFVGLGSAEVAALARVAPWADGAAPDIAREFYDHQFAFAPTRDFFAAFAARRGVSMGDLRRTLEAAQAGYLRDIFREAAGAGEFGPAYFARRLAVGKLHNVINLPLKWYLGSYPLYQRQFSRRLRRHYLLRPGLCRKVEAALGAVVNLDQQAIVDSFFYDYLQSIGLDLASVTATGPDEDLSERYAELKSTVRATLDETARTTRALLVVGGTMTEVAADAGRATGEINVAMRQVAQGAADQARAATESSGAVKGLSSAIEDLRRTSAETSGSVAEASAAVNALA